MLDEALSYLDRGLSIVPLRPDGKRPLGRWKPLQSSPMSRRAARTFWSGVISPAPGLGLVTGYGELAVLDVEPEMRRFVEREVSIPTAAPVAETARGGLHVYCRSENLRCGKLRVGGEIVGDVRGVGGYVVAPPTAIRGKGRYGWASGYGLEDGVEGLPGVPEWAQSRDRGRTIGVEGSALSPPLVLPRSRPLELLNSTTAAILFARGPAGLPPAVRQTPSEVVFWVCCEGARAGLDFEDVEDLFAASPVLQSHLIKHVEGYLFDTWRNACFEVAAELDGAVDVECWDAVASLSNRRSRERASLFLWSRETGGTYVYTIPTVLGDGALSGEWRRACFAFGLEEGDGPLSAIGRKAAAVLYRGKVKYLVPREGEE